MKRVAKLCLICLMMMPSSFPMAVEKDVDMSYQCEKIIIEENKQDVNLESIKGEIKIPLITAPNTNFTKSNNEKLKKWVDAWLVDLEDLAKKYEEDVKKDKIPFHPFEVASNYSIQYQKCPYLSFYIDYYQFTGGAHGITTRKAYNYDLNKNRELMLKDLFKEGYNYKEVINKEISKQIEKNKDYYFVDKNGFKGISDTQLFTFSDKDITIYFQLYEIAPYVTGIPAFNIPKSILKDGLI